jgi:hypothetical protein
MALGRLLLSLSETERSETKKNFVDIHVIDVTRNFAFIFPSIDPFK